MINSRFACDSCLTTADGTGGDGRVMPHDWENITVRVINCNGPRRVDRDICPTCLKLPLADLLQKFRIKVVS